MKNIKKDTKTQKYDKGIYKGLEDKPKFSLSTSASRKSLTQVTKKELVQSSITKLF